MKITPFILGSGKAATAILEALRVIEIHHTDLDFSPVQRIKRGSPIPDVSNLEYPVLFIATPHALHAKAILEGEEAGFKLIVVEKPAAASFEQIEALRKVKTPVAVCHVYRQTWGIQTLKQMIENGDFGNLISIEGRYWQSSSALKALTKQKTSSWKNDPHLSGPSDVLFDLASHWVDAAIYLAGERPQDINIWRSFLNAEAPHRDTHVQVTMDFPSGFRAMSSVSKTIHGAPNHFEINLIGSKKYGCWKFQEPDLLEVSEGLVRTIHTRKTMEIGSGHWAHHGLGWLEGYVEIIRQALLNGHYPTLQENLQMMELLVNKI